MITIKDIALEMGLSTATVSNALSSKGRVSEAKRRAILETARRMGYDLSRIHTAPASRWETRRLVEPEVYLELAVARLESRPLPAMSAALDDAVAVMLAAGNDTDVSEGGAQ